jgi:hypothetical protein
VGKSHKQQHVAANGERLFTADLDSDFIRDHDDAERQLGLIGQWYSGQQRREHDFAISDGNVYAERLGRIG